jgi:hypothetical protein
VAVLAWNGLDDADDLAWLFLDGHAAADTEVVAGNEMAEGGLGLGFSKVWSSKSEDMVLIMVWVGLVK